MDSLQAIPLCRRSEEARYKVPAHALAIGPIACILVEHPFFDQCANDQRRIGNHHEGDVPDARVRQKQMDYKIA